MHDLVAITALGGTEPRVDTIGSVTCTEVPGVALASVASRMGKESKSAKALAKLIDAPVPEVGRWAGTSICAFWAGVDQWMVEAPFDTHEDLADQAKKALGDAASVTEQTDGWTRFDLTGTGIPSVLELLCQLDLRKMTGGSVARCSIHHIGCFVLCRTSESYSIYGPRSSAGSLHHAIKTAMRSAL
ncbi:MAG: sarcosine oxidase subunit gamma [Ruegeria sp.]|nr:sarcosine oxidase subunit gamma [Ruegeria sp.]